MEDHDPFAALDQVSRAYIGLHDAMMSMYFKKDYAGSMRLAAQLLTKAECPPLIEARCHMVLSTRKNSPLAVIHAEAAVTIIDVNIRNMLVAEAFPQNQLDEAHRCLAAAHRRAAERAAAEATQKAANEAMPKSADILEEEPTAPPEAVGSQEPQKSSGLSKADQLALKEAATLLPSATQPKYGLATPGPSRSHTGQQPPAPKKPAIEGRITRSTSGPKQQPTPKKGRGE